MLSEVEGSAMKSNFTSYKKEIEISQLGKMKSNRTTRIRHQFTKTTVLSCHRCLINTGVEKNEQHLNID